ncbi:hypothetical protein FHS85_000509 [Rhodoligotrophos appendicifer]|uniref:hypothetical protein n=1 Tax=Rhodoligotrophos appendicifer TaxID=987056 RepID=UPI00117FF66C|nr:hypothetical protein [Rhodoligotrophos appendicifer]
MSLSFIRALMVFAALSVGGVLSIGPAAADTIYDSNVGSKLSDLDSGQKAQVASIIQQSKSQMLAVFKQYNIDPNAAPVFDKLMKASGPLQQIARQERQAMSKVLNPAQMKQYDQVINETRTRVRMAAK